MNADTDRRAQRASLPWLLAGLLLMGLELGAWLGLRYAGSTGGALETAVRVVGLLGAGGFLVGLAALAYGRRRGRQQAVLWLAALLWVGEALLRLQAIGLDVYAGGGPAAADAAGDPNPLAAFRLIAAGSAGAFLSLGMWRWWRGRGGPAGEWRLAAGLFALQVAALAVGPLLVDPREVLALGWLLFLAPFVWLLRTLGATARELARRQGMGEHLAES